METKPTLKIYYADLTFGNFRLLPHKEPEKKFLEQISGMKYGREDAETHTLRILLFAGKKYSDDDAILHKIMSAAESVLVDYHKKRGVPFFLYDVENEEHVIYGKIDKKSPVGTGIIRITRIIKGAIYRQHLADEDYETRALLDNESVKQYVKFDMEHCANLEDYEEAAVLRDFLAELEKK